MCLYQHYTTIEFQLAMYCNWCCTSTTLVTHPLFLSNSHKTISLSRKELNLFPLRNDVLFFSEQRCSMKNSRTKKHKLNCRINTRTRSLSLQASWASTIRLFTGITGRGRHYNSSGSQGWRTPKIDNVLTRNSSDNICQLPKVGLDNIWTNSPSDHFENCGRLWKGKEQALEKEATHLWVARSKGGIACWCCTVNFEEPVTCGTGNLWR